MSQFLVIGNAGCRRVHGLQAALEQLGRLSAQLVEWRDLIARRVVLTDIIRPGAVVRIESPGRDFKVECALLAAGAKAAEAEGCAWIGREAIERLQSDKGRLLWPRQWFLGFAATLAEIWRQLSESPPHHLLNDTAEIAVLFDKRQCHARLLVAGMPVPRGLGEPRSYNELLNCMSYAGRNRVFAKLAHGSSACGVVAFETNGRQQHATTTVEMHRVAGELRLYNSRRVRVYRESLQIAELFDELCRHGVHVEEWLPKAGIAGQRCDLRILTINGRARHTDVAASVQQVQVGHG